MTENEKFLNEETADAVAEETNVDWRTLCEAAKDFLDKYDILLEESEISTESLSAYKKASVLYSKAKESMNITRAMANLARDFESTLNKFLKRRIILTYVDEDGLFSFHSEATEEALYNALGVDSKGSRGQFSIAQMKQGVAGPLLKEIEDMDERQSYMKKPYLTAVKRYEEKENEKKFYWFNDNNDKEWSKKIGNKGRLAESYALIVLKGKEKGKEVVSTKELSRKEDEGSKGKISLLNDYVRPANENTPGLVEGDVVSSINKSIQFAIKSFQASSAAFGQYYRVAYNIIGFQKKSKEFTPAQIEGALIKMTRGVNYGDIIKIIEEKSIEKIFEQAGQK